MTNEQVMQIMTELGLHEGGLENWVYDNAWVKVVNRALAEQAEQEPVAWMQEMPTSGNEIRSVRMTTIEKFAHEEWVNPIPLYAAPVRTKDLTDDEIAQAVGSPLDEVYLADFRAVIAADRRKNK